jgi:hypothetical protein
MLIEEARWFSRAVNALSAEELSPILNLGSGTSSYRLAGAHSAFFSTLKKAGIVAIHTDIEAGEGVDVAGDIFSEHLVNELVARVPSSLICANILEHVERPLDLADICSSLLGPGGYLFASVPKFYPYHPAPIDTMYRPNPEELSRLFPDFDVLKSEVVVCRSLFKQCCNEPVVGLRVLASLVLGLVSFNKPRVRKELERIRYIMRPLLVSAVVLRKRN